VVLFLFRLAVEHRFCIIQAQIIAYSTSFIGEENGTGSIQVVSRYVFMIRSLETMLMRAQARFFLSRP
ncbi:MAG: hypothetical protein PVH39_07530, partial [Syntrophobacterales bacterium]